MEVLLQPFKKAWSHFGGNHGFWGLRPAGLCTNATNAVNATPFQKSFDEDYPEVFSSVLFTIASCERPCELAFLPSLGRLSLLWSSVTLSTVGDLRSSSICRMLC
jgi:hypothetical protein